MRHRWLVVGGVLALTVLLASTAFPWQLEMKGKWDTDYEYFSQRGSEGFFGQWDVDHSAVTGAADLGLYRQLNLWIGRRGFASGHDASRNRSKLETNIELDINKAVRLRGAYRIGSVIPGDGSRDYDSNYSPNSSAIGTKVSMAVGEWTMLWGTVQTPMGIVVYGKRPFTVGCGLQYNGQADLTAESLLLVAPYGPFRIAAGWYPSRPSGFDNLNNAWDKNGHRGHWLAFIDYDSGPMAMGVGMEWVDWHYGAEQIGARGDLARWSGNAAGVINSPFTTAAEVVDVGYPLLIDRSQQDAWAFVKYNNGRFFFNAEVDWFNEINRTVYNIADTATLATLPTFDGQVGNLPPIPARPPTYIESYRYMVEMGMYSGPGKVTVAYVHLPGPDWRNGAFIDRQPWINGSSGPVPAGPATPFGGIPGGGATFGANFSNTTVFQPYSLLFGWTYGSGTGSFNFNRHGYVNDASVIMARLDYSVAANLTAWASFLYAERASNGWTWGCLSPAQTGTASPFGETVSGTAGRLQPVNLHLTGTPGTIVGLNATADGTLAPTIPDTELGWEAGGGIYWNVIENILVQFRVAWWQPGKWFSYACRDRNVIGWDTTPGAFNYYGTNPGRSIDAIVGFYNSIEFSF